MTRQSPASEVLMDGILAVQVPWVSTCMRRMSCSTKGTCSEQLACVPGAEDAAGLPHL